MDKFIKAFPYHVTSSHRNLMMTFDFCFKMKDRVWTDSNGRLQKSMSYSCLPFARVPTATGAADHPDQLADEAEAVAERAQDGTGPLSARGRVAELTGRERVGRPGM